MHLMMVGLNHRTTSVELRERVAFSEDDLARGYGLLNQARTMYETVILSTCNRTEVYCVAASTHGVEDYLPKLLARRANLDVQELRPHLEILQGEAVIRHLMKVASGLDSMVVGETQILGQVRDAFALAVHHGAVGSMLHSLFQMSIALGKRAHTETGIGENAVSVSYAAVQLAKKIFGNLDGSRALVVGAGKMSQLTMQHLSTNGIQDVEVVNRSFAKAQEVALQFGGRAIDWADLESALGRADIVVSSTGARGFVVTRSGVEQAVRRRGGRPMVFIDIAVPRDVEPSVAELGHVFLYDIDDLEGVVAANLAERAREALAVEEMIDEACADFLRWLDEQRVVPVIAAVRAKGEQIQAQVMESLERKLPELSERELKLIRKHTMSIVNQMLRDPIQNMKELANRPGGADAVQQFAELFGVDEGAWRQAASAGATDKQAHANRDESAESLRIESLRGAKLSPALR